MFLDREEYHFAGNLSHENIYIFLISSLSNEVFPLAKLLGAPLEV